MVNPWPGRPVTLEGEDRFETLTGARLTFQTKVGETVVLTQA